jgi:hypothetical protein
MFPSYKRIEKTDKEVLFTMSRANFFKNPQTVMSQRPLGRKKVLIRESGESNFNINTEELDCSKFRFKTFRQQENPINSQTQYSLKKWSSQNKNSNLKCLER